MTPDAIPEALEGRKLHAIGEHHPDISVQEVFSDGIRWS